MTLTAAALKSIIGSLGYSEIQQVKGNTYNIVVAKDLPSVVPNIFRAIKAFDPQVVIPSNLPYKPENKRLKVSGFDIGVVLKKNKKVGKHLTFGRENEANLAIIISDYLKVHGNINIEFTKHGRTIFAVNNVVKVNKTGKDIANRKKADIELVDGQGRRIPLSLKQNDSPFWESPDTYWGATARMVLDYALAKKHTELQPFDGIFRLSNGIAIKATQQEAKDLIFGNDILPNGAILKQTWQQGHVKWFDDHAVLALECTEVIRTLSDVSDSDSAYFQIRNHRDKNSKHLYPGLYLLAVRKETVKNDSILPPEARHRSN